MQLCYRGITYQPKTNPVNTVESGTGARFLGKTYTVRLANCPIILQPNLYKYRGVTYQRGNQEVTIKEKHYSEKSGLTSTVS